MNGGLVSNCVVSGNTILEDSGVGIWARANSTIVDSWILDNRQTSNNRTTWGAGIYANGGNILIRNCLVAGNVGKDHGAGIYGGTVENCTVVSNRSWKSTSQGGGVYNSTVISSVVLHNSSGSGAPAVANYGGSSSLSYSCAVPLPSGLANVDSAIFEDESAGDFRLQACAAVDAGQNAAWMTNAVDLAGQPRLAGAGGVVDMGAFEKVPGALECGFTAAPRETAVAGADVVFTALPFGTNTSLTGAHWGVGDGQHASGIVVTNAFASPGVYTVSLAITNSAGETAAATYTGYITIWGTQAFVATNSPDPLAPYHSWSNAADSVVAALELVPAGTDVVVSNGTYDVPGQVTLNEAVTIRGFGSGGYGGLANASNTVIRRPSSNPNHRVFQISDAGVVVDGVTVTGGRGRGVSGMGVNMSAGMLRNSIIRDNGDTSTSHAGLGSGVGIWMNGGVVSNCTIEGNLSPESEGIGIRAQGASQIIGCRILDNTKTAQYSRSGGGIYATASVLIRDSLIARNTARDAGGGIYGRTVVNCTIVSNRIYLASGDGGGVFLSGGSTVSNSIVYFNEVVGVHSNLNTLSGVGSSCVAHPGSSLNGNITADPMLVDLAAGDYRLADASPCINAGDSSIVDWPTDLAGRNRRAGPDVDMGAYEWQPPGGSVITVR